MVNVYAERAQKAENILFWSRVKNAVSYVPWVVGIACAVIGAIFATLGNGCQAASENLSNQSVQDEQKAQQIINGNKEEWKKEVRKEKVDSDSISITSSEDGEVVDLAT